LPKIIYSYSKKLGFKFIHFSSASVFDSEVFKKKYQDQSKPKPITVLGKSKYMSETFLLNKKRVIIIRLPMLFGPRHKKHLIYKLLINLKKNKKRYASNNVYCTPVYTPNLVSFINKKIFKKDVLFKNKLKNNLINFSSYKYISIFSLIEIFAKYLKKEKYLFSVKDSFFDQNSTKPKYLGLQFNRKYTLNITLKSCVKNYLNQGY
jgi:dTDP-4-dehydrorhamnose reductase